MSYIRSDNLCDNVTTRQSDQEISKVHTVALVSLGCPKNLIDSEKMFGLLVESGLTPTSDESMADAIVINTCGFLEASKQEAIDEIQRATQWKKNGRCKRVVVAGCLVQRQRAKILDICPDIDAIIGVFDRDRIVKAVVGINHASTPSTAIDDPPVYSSIASGAAMAKRNRQIHDQGYYEDDSARLRLTPRHFAYLRVSEGCNQNCTFCTIPSIRGKMRSKPVDHIVAEARELIDDGAIEINLIGQDTTSFGQDLGYDAGLIGMLEALDRTVSQNTDDGGGWLRLMYAYPSCFTDAMIDAIARLPNVLNYIDLPLQHINDRVLMRMRRGTSRSQIETLLDKLRTRIPDIAIRTTFITGFPGETEAEHRELVQFLNEFRFDAMGVFRYSPEPGTPAETMHRCGNAIPDEIVDQRYEELMLAQQKVVFAHNEKLASQSSIFNVLIDSTISQNQQTKEPDGSDQQDSIHPKMWHIGRTYFQAPQIDGRIHIDSSKPLTTGEMIPCQIIASDGYDLIAKPLIDSNHPNNRRKSEVSTRSVTGISLTILK